jgi:polyisoprenoid-binding protein YceI
MIFKINFNGGKMKRIILVIACLVSANVSVQAKEVKKSIDTDASVVSWLGKKKLVGDKHFGKIKIKEGYVIFDDKGHPKTAQVIIDMNTISNDDLKNKGYNAKLVGHLSGEDFFNIKKYPTSTLTINSFAKSAVDKKDAAKNAFLYKASGDLKIKDVVEPIGFETMIKPESNIHRGSGKLVINRTRWGVKYGSESFFKGLGDKVIADDMEFDFNIVTLP